MAQKLSVKIELEGAKEIARQLESLGETGANAFKKMGAEAEKVGGFSRLDPTVVTQNLANMGITGVDAINQIKGAVEQAGRLEQLVQGVQQAENAFGALGKAIRPLGGELRNLQQAASAIYGVVGPIGVAGVAAFAGITTAVTAATKATIAFAGSVNKINDQAIGLGKGIEQVDKFRAGLEKAGVSAESVAQILQSKLASEQGIAGLESFIRELEQIPNSAARSKAAVEQFGAAGAELIRILQAGGRLTGFKVGGLISAEDAQRATELNQSINRLEASISRINTLGFAPALTVGINAATAAVDLLGARLQQAPWQTFLIGAQLAFNPIQGLVNTAIAALMAVKPAVDQIGIATQQSGVMFTQWGTIAKQEAAGVGTAVQQGVQIWTQWGTAATQAGDQAATGVKKAMDAAKQPIPTQSWTDWAISAARAVDTILAKLRELLGLKQQATPAAAAASGGAPGLAGGGLLGGRGTGTSDSNLAWLSRGEHIMPARAVAQPGVLAFLEALRRSGGDLRRVLDGMGRFALGGMVPRSMGIPAYAAGGLAGGSNVTIQFPGLPAISGLRASSDVVDQLHKAAALAQVRSGGRKPSRYS